MSTCSCNPEIEFDESCFEHGSINRRTKDFLDAVETLRKIDEPHRYHHVEPDSYTQLACAQYQAHECLKRLGKYEKS